MPARAVPSTARKTETIANIRTITGTTAAAATPTLVKMGVYSVGTNGDLTLVASTASDTALFATASTAYTKALTASFTKHRGQRYALAILVISGSATPTFTGISSTGINEAAIDPRLSGQLSAQSDLPSTVAGVSVTTSGAQIYGVLTP